MAAALAPRDSPGQDPNGNSNPYTDHNGAFTAFSAQQSAASVASALAASAASAASAANNANAAPTTNAVDSATTAQLPANTAGAGTSNTDGSGSGPVATNGTPTGGTGAAAAASTGAAGTTDVPPSSITPAYHGSTQPSTFDTSVSGNSADSSNGPATAAALGLATSASTPPSGASLAAGASSNTLLPEPAGNTTDTAHHGPAPGTIAAAVSVSVLLALAALILTFWCLRRRHRQPNSSGPLSLPSFIPAAMRERFSSHGRIASINTPLNPPLAATTTTIAAEAGAAAAAGLAPAFLAPVLMSERNNAYFTGLDTSSRGSRSGRSGHSGEYYAPGAAAHYPASLEGGGSLSDPPPPYVVGGVGKKSIGGQHEDALVVPPFWGPLGGPAEESRQNDAGSETGSDPFDDAHRDNILTAPVSLSENASHVGPVDVVVADPSWHESSDLTSPDHGQGTSSGDAVIQQGAAHDAATYDKAAAAAAPPISSPTDFSTFLAVHSANDRPGTSRSLTAPSFSSTLYSDSASVHSARAARLSEARLSGPGVEVIAAAAGNGRGRAGSGGDPFGDGDV